MKVGLENKKTLVIGGARGIGAEIVRNCALSGSDVAWSYRQGSAESDILLKELNSSGRNGFAVQADRRSARGYRASQRGCEGGNEKTDPSRRYGIG